LPAVKKEGVCPKKPDLVLVDLSMPKMSDMDAIREIKRRSPKTKILVLIPGANVEGAWALAHGASPVGRGEARPLRGG